jgi:hypothetical protein
MPAKPKLKPLVSVAKSVAVMNARRKRLDNVELVRKLHAVGETRRADLLRDNAHQDALRMREELRSVDRQGGLISARHREEHKKRLAELQQIAAGAMVK